MQEYLLKNSFREKMDAIGYYLLVLALCCGWFLVLWGVRLQALIAGLGLWGLCLMLRHKTRDHRLARKEQKLRRRIGGEMLVEKLLFSAPDKAHFEAALHLSLAENLMLERMTRHGVLCKNGEERLLLSFFQAPASETLTARDVLSLQQAALLEKAAALWLCIPCAIGSDARIQGEKKLPVRFITRDQLIHLLGNMSPATDRQLVELGREKQKHIPFKNILRIVFQPGKARRYALYGLLLLFLYTLTGLPYYAVPGIICVSFAAISHCFRP